MNELLLDDDAGRVVGTGESLSDNAVFPGARQILQLPAPDGAILDIFFWTLNVSDGSLVISRQSGLSGGNAVNAISGRAQDFHYAGSFVDTFSAPNVLGSLQAVGERDAFAARLAPEEEPAQAQGPDFVLFPAVLNETADTLEIGVFLQIAPQAAQAIEAIIFNLNYDPDQLEPVYTQFPLVAVSPGPRIAAWYGKQATGSFQDASVVNVTVSGGRGQIDGRFPGNANITANPILLASVPFDKLGSGVAAIAVTEVDAADGNAATISSIAAGDAVLPIGLAGLQGRLATALTDSPLTCAVVVLTDAQGQSFTSATDLRGRYAFSGLEPGIYDVSIAAPDFGSQQSESLLLEPGVTGLRDFSLAPAPPATTIRGRVTDAEDGAALVGVECRVLRGGEVIAVTFTCADGSYEYPDLSSSIYAGLKQASNLTLDYDLPNYNDQSAAISLNVGEQPTRDVQLQKNGLFPNSLAGTVFDTVTLAAVDGAQVQLQGPVNQAVTTDDEGRYMFPAILPGAYTVRTSADSYESSLSPKAVPANPLVQQLDVALTQEDAVTLPGDVNGDEAINAVDVQLVINAALGLPFHGEPDINADDAIDAVDIQLVVNAALGL